jgi:hypothetical protein
MEKIDFDNLSRKAFAPGAGIPELNELWGHTFLLPHWNFIARGPVTQPQPYIASRQDVCQGQDMIRSFTDNEKLTAFARQNNLLEADQSVRTLSVPTVNIIPWLLNYSQYGIYGIWFNSDTGSNGYYAPLTQLWAVKEHLDKTWNKR